MTLQPEQRANVRVLLVEDNAINQQIALKTIRKLGFDVSAVWNGKEALDYLLATNSPNPSHPKPDIILMDVQMPIIDGYKATHILRRHHPYSSLLGNIPIVAMTASAIQGDREKCEKAGMDDYLAKPVRAKTLEKMLVRWATANRLPRTQSDGGSDDCSESGEHNCGTVAVPIFGQGGSSKSSHGSRKPIDLQSRLQERQDPQHLTLPGPETEADRIGRREEAEEKATALRDEKLVDAAGIRGEYNPQKQKGGEQKLSLTTENIEKLEREAEDQAGGRDEGASDGSEGADSLEGLDGDVVLERPKMARWRDSEMTVKQSDA